VFTEPRRCLNNASRAFPQMPRHKNSTCDDLKTLEMPKPAHSVKIFRVGDLEFQNLNLRSELRQSRNRCKIAFARNEESLCTPPIPRSPQPPRTGFSRIWRLPAVRNSNVSWLWCGPKCSRVG